MSQKYYKMAELRKAFRERGLYSGNNLVYFTTKIRRLEALGRLVVLRDRVTKHRMFTKQHIKGIVKALSPGGKGYWSYKKLPKGK